MIIVKLWGGIGNQLFQYVFGQYLAYRYHQDVYYDNNSYISVDKLRKGELDSTSCTVNYDNRCSFSKYRGVKNRILRWAFQCTPKCHYIQEGASIPTNYKTEHLYFFQGYWQDYKYYEWVKNNVSDFAIFSNPFPTELKRIRDGIKICGESISLHVRRGDYFKPAFIKTFGVCNSRYYEDALKSITGQFEEVRIFVFTDDPNWVEENINFGRDYTMIPNYDVSQFAYIELMSLCRHHIISNSSFSWWGAILNEQQNAIVISPDKWLNTTDKTLALDKWTKIHVYNE